MAIEGLDHPFILKTKGAQKVGNHLVVALNHAFDSDLNWFQSAAAKEHLRVILEHKKFFFQYQSNFFLRSAQKLPKFCWKTFFLTHRNN